VCNPPHSCNQKRAKTAGDDKDKGPFLKTFAVPALELSPLPGFESCCYHLPWMSEAFLLAISEQLPSNDSLEAPSRNPGSCG